MGKSTLIGKRTPMIDAAAKAAGTAIYVDDMKLPGMLVGKILHSPYPHARIKRIDASRARALDGVVAIVTGEDLVRDSVAPLPLSADFKRADGSPTASPPRHALAVGTVRFVGEAAD